MKKWFRIAALPLIGLCTFASVEAATDAPAQNAQSSSLYCWKNKLYEAGDDLACNRAQSATDACKGNPSCNVSKGFIATEPTDGKRCENGQ